jgi:nitrogen fixation NifU-like protein
MTENMDPSWLGDNNEEEVYKENIIDHYKNPRNFKELNPSTIKQREMNTVCGDDVTMYLDIKDGKIAQASFKGNGCAISIAASSMLTDYLKGKTVEEAKNIPKEQIFEMLGIKLGVVRMKCGLLCLKAVVKGIHNKDLEVKYV